MSKTMIRMAAWLIVGTALTACLPGQDRQAPALLVSRDEALMQIGIPKLGAQANLKRIGENQGVETWQSGDGVSVSVQQGVVVATRGLGFDLMAADVSPTLSAMAGGDPGPYRRQMRYLTGDNHSRYLAAGCVMETRNGTFTESCKTHRGSFTNQYQGDTGDAILASRQWISPEVGYLEIKPAP